MDPEHVPPEYHAYVSAPVPPDEVAVNCTVCPSSIEGAFGVIVTVSADPLTVTVSVAVTVTGEWALSVTATQYVVVAVNAEVV
jgi:hypothetical protein